MKPITKLLPAIGLFLLALKASGQGCSDAGLCTLNSFKPNPADSTSYTSQLKSGLSYGIADHGITVIGAYLEYNRYLNDKISLDAKIAMLAQSNNSISVAGLSDLYLSANYNINRTVTVTLGAKIPFTDGNKIKDDRPLPMDFQASLGTFDLIAGIGFSLKGVQVVAAFQQPLTQNKNQFIAGDYPPDAELRKFQTTNKFIRSGDVLLRLSYPFSLGQKFRFTPSLLPIYHLTNDKFTAMDGVEKAIAGSQGLTLNANAYCDLQLDHNNSLQLNIGAPLVVREARPDGLTRYFLVSVEYRLKF